MGPEAFDYALPPEQIAQAPAARRSDARMLVLAQNRIKHTRAGMLAEVLPPEALVVVNASRVVPARLSATRDDGRQFELLLCEPGATHADPTEPPRVRAWVRGAKALRPGQRLHVGEALRLRYLEPDDVDPRARWFAVEAGDVLQACHDHGEVPLPPYIARPDGPDAGDAERYQTVYAAAEGSVAAPTAGLHFEPAMLDAIDWVPITLHVGPGTFLPMAVADVREHRVGHERVSIDALAATRIATAQREGRPIVAVGTTVIRALETAALRTGAVEPFEGRTDLVITPGHRFATATHLLTNFHLPRSSLLMLVCSFGGRERVLDAYREAVAEGYRFYSYGDCMFLEHVP